MTEVCPDSIPVEHTRGHLPDHCPTCTTTDRPSAKEQP